MQGIESPHILTDSQGQSYLDSKLEMPDTVAKMVKEISEIGWLYQKINQKQQDTGPIQKALKLAINE